ncbi:hypothetical protein CO134_00200 [Candidatus Kuenenbacteria bacterium CG_4_9_14_3_um_filter_39_14]|uniref:Uncharacterized protein n=6 Tax=Candidatus Kueneniibacteriota TaxID=1752740 RepID=A0A2M7MHE9_9BACT|nr:MAG: hypothetical protein AUK13_01160 [Candidatus Kuenenbacteria bacterium CG2_30_39_24]PIP28984.1 MAG: hypothetical protein COX28_01670 [Candidatus Kuenenbacteria bacterium CG23_combo_of_CG06-09_8_20_14_all_39_39]PIP75200.1 MAG: hypothetical protein COW86_05160 [Candidatus Kuenenbacteria bacterium CG22_combo_CG10-13_8_21_14_all_39_9]PIR80551.1 MAG: hypothetical protein COU24_03470 [Candidatus Kuenenbacteria bacterium CG10_big_fil_rev_8_21_14_0_10_39_14]PIX92510.1 MAG: hypothetical protein C
MRLIKKITNDIFYISLITYAVYFMLELLKEGLISNYFDLNLLLIFIIIFAILTIIFYDKKRTS